MEAKHTPGPWEAERIDNSNCVYIKCERGFFIATCHDGVRGESNAIANARLIAAAPELLEALQSLLKSFPTEDDMHIAGWEQSEIDLACRDYEAARAAVAKATQ